ncbi:hypothetical protein GQX73_g5863 [Xylaria multiplex]|uniref:CFEM domain-containing protein n=1 Tax=Xylaria multiplex TaxID=323545 RepID=A0A7C8ITM0_9PEZI|nr:hypothetical protein GQX73_g5863 [Xylaria multiplex]
MRSITIVLSLLATRAIAITNDELAAKIPDCAKGCLEDGYKAVNCSITDYPCQCDNAHRVFEVADPCLNQTCTTPEENDKLAAATTWLCMAIAQQSNPNWTGPPVTDHLPPSIQSRFMKTSAAVGQVVASVGFVGAVAAFALVLLDSVRARDYTTPTIPLSNIVASATGTASTYVSWSCVSSRDSGLSDPATPGTSDLTTELGALVLYHSRAVLADPFRPGYTAFLQASATM